MSDSPAPAFPEMRDALLSASELLALRDDLKSCARVTSVMEKGAPQAHASSEQPALAMEDSLQRLLAGQVRAVQIRYAYDGYEWSDTLLSLAGGFRLVRCRCDPR